MSRESNHNTVRASWRASEQIAIQAIYLFDWLTQNGCWAEIESWACLEIQIMSGCNKHINVDVIDPSNNILYYKWLFIICTTRNSSSRGTLRSCHPLINTDSLYLSSGTHSEDRGLLHDCSLFVIYLIAVSLTVAPLGLWFPLICAIKNSPMHYVEPVWCVNDV